MSVETRRNESLTSDNSIKAVPPSLRMDQDVVSASRSKTTKRRMKLSSRINMWIRRVHLFSGLFMLPWVLLYGFTALLFNHPTFMAGPKTEIESFTLSNSEFELLPSAHQIAERAVATAQSKLAAGNSQQTIKLAKDSNAIFTRQVAGTVEDDNQNVSVILNLNDGKGYLRKRKKGAEREPIGLTPEQEKVAIEDGLKLQVKTDPVASFRSGVQGLLEPYELDSTEINIRSMPNLEFDALVDGKPVRLRLSQEQNRNRRENQPLHPNDEAGTTKEPIYKSHLSIVGQNPREMNARSFLLRLHMAHGYGVQTNSRWFWAIAVDLMFASMCFWGLSGVVMWWQIKRTRKIGFILLVASAIVATWLAIGMHWQLTNG